MCPVCLGIVHGKRVLTEEVRAFCRQLWHATLERSVPFVEKVLRRMAVAQHDSLLSKSGLPALFGSEDKGYLVDVPAISLADNMEYVHGSAGGELGPCKSTDQPWAEPAAHQDDEDLLDISLDLHGLSEGEQESLL